MKPDSDERDIVASVFAPLATNKIDLWYRDQEEIVQTVLKLKSLEDVIVELRKRHQSWIAVLSSSRQLLVKNIEAILEKHGSKSMEELFRIYNEAMRNRG
jgi:hypothetical protein